MAGVTPFPISRILRHLPVILLLLLGLAACGGSGSGNSFDPPTNIPSNNGEDNPDNSDDNPDNGGDDPDDGDDNPDDGGDNPDNSDNVGEGWTPGVFLPADTFAQHCAEPRPTDVQGTFIDENNWLRSWHHDTYLWYDDMPDIDPSSAPTQEYFHQLRTPNLTPSDRPVDNFRFSMGTDEWNDRVQSGVSAGYGARWAMINSQPPRDVRVALVEPGSPADQAGLVRGTRVLAVNGVDMVSGSDIGTLNAGLFPGELDQTFTFTFEFPDSSQEEIELTSAEVISVPVQNVTSVDTPSGKVGYILFNSHIATAEALLVEATEQLASEDVTDLVLDLRYNGGGFLYIASLLSYFIAGEDTLGETFYETRFNDQHPDVDPVTDLPLQPTPFYNSPDGDSFYPSLELERVFVLTGGSTCSASEAIINGLRGIDIEVIQIGATTCGKPYGGYGTDNCGTTYSIVQFTGVNAKGFGEYPNGFSPVDHLNPPGVPLPGCALPDDFSKQLGDVAEARFAAALAYRETGVCPGGAGSQKTGRLPDDPEPLILPELVPTQHLLLR